MILLSIILDNCLYNICKEIENLIKLDHHHIVNIYEYYLYSDRIFIVMEYLKGGELFDIINKFPTYLTENNIRKIMKDLLEAVAYMHSKNFGKI